MTLGLNREGTRQKYTHQKRLTNQSGKVGVDYAARIHLFEFSPVVAVNCDNREALGKERWHKAKFEKSPKNDSIEFRKKKENMTKWKSNFKSTNC